MSTNYIIYGEKLYKRSYDGIHILYVTAKEAQQIIEEVYELSYGPYMNAHMLSRKIGLLLDHYGSRLCGSCSKMPSMSSSWRFETYVTHATTVGKSSFVSHTKHITKATYMDLFHS